MAAMQPLKDKQLANTMLLSSSNIFTQSVMMFLPLIDTVSLVRQCDARYFHFQYHYLQHQKLAQDLETSDFR
jgi:hypothetical protein